MKKLRSKPILFLLIACLSLVWGLVIVNFRKAVSGKATEIPQIRESVVVKETPSKGKLMLDYPDPFLKDLHQAEIVEDTDQTYSEDTISENEDAQEQIFYKGRIGTGRSRFYVVTIDGSEHILTEGENEGEIFLRSCSDDSLMLVIGSRELTVHFQI